MDQAVVIGASIAGLAATCALAERAATVTLVERTEVPDDTTPSSVAPQGGFPHVLLAGGAAALERLAPGLVDDLFARGAVGEVGGDQRGHWWAEGRVRRTIPDLGVPVPLCSRALVETRLRAHVRSLRNVVVLGGTAVRGLRSAADRVRGVDATRDGSPVPLDADLVVDASGRSARGARWLRDVGLTAPATSRVDVGVTYTTVSVERRPDDLNGALFAVVQNTAASPRIGVALPAEGGRWQIVLGGYFGDTATPTPHGMRTFADSLPDAAISHLLRNDWVAEPATFKFPASRRQHWERLPRLPAGFVVVGDAVASFNPLYGQGMSSAALQAEALGQGLDQVGNTPRLPHVVAKAAAAVVTNPWQIATGADFIYPQTRGPRPLGTRLLNRYLAKVIAAAADDRTVNVALSRVQQMLAPPPTLLSPAIIRRVLAHGRKHRAHHTSDHHARGHPTALPHAPQP